MEDDIFIECPHCGLRYTVVSGEMHISDIQDDPSDVYPKFCTFCGKEIDI